MKNYLQKKTAILIIAVIFFIQSTSLFAYIGNKADYNKDLEETLTTAYEKSPKLISASLSFYVGSVFSSDFINYAKSMGLEEGKADRWLTESRLISTFTNAFNLYASYEKGDSIGMTASAIKVLLNLNSFDALKVIKIAYPYGPIISLLLTGAQVTAESYRAVAQTGREVDIERLYIMLRQDKKLRPEKGELINMDTRENVNYVFDKFLMSGNAEFRRLINSYLVEKLGKSIPTEDIKNRFNFNTGMAYEGPAETAMTIEEFYNQNKPEILTYLAALLKEVNLLLKAQFEEIKLRKEIIAKKAELEKLDYLAKTFGNLFERWDDMIKANKALIEKYEPIARNFNARLEDAKRQNVGTAAREVRDEAQFAIMTMEERGYYTEDKQANVINVALMGNRVMDILNILRPGLKQAAALAKALGEKEDAEEKKAYEEYVKQSQKIIEGFVSFKLDKYPLDAKMAEFKEKIDKYFREGGINGTEIFNSLELDKFSEEFDTFYKKQWEEQKQANIEKFKELDKKWQSIDVPWEKSEEFMGFANSKDYVAFEKAKEAYYKRRDEKFAEVDKIREKVSAAWNVFCLDFETNSGFTAGSLTGGGGDASSYVLGGQGFYTFVPLLRERIAAWERIIKIAGQEQGDIYSNAQPPALLNDVESWIKFNDKVISVVEKLPYPEANFNKIPGIDENNLNETLQKLNDALSQREAAFSEDFSAYFDSTVSTETELSFSIVSNQIKKLDGYIQELKTYIERRNKANSQADAALAKWKITPSAGIDTTIGAAEKLIKNFEKFKRTVPEALKKLEGLYESARDEVAGQRGFIQGRIVLVKSLISLPLLANFEKIKGDIKAGYPLKASYINEGAKGYLNKDEINKLKDGISKTMTPERMQSLASSSPKLHKQVVEITDLVSKIKPVEKNEVVGFDGKTILNASEQEAQLNKANTLSELNALNWETALTNNSIDIESNNQFAVNYRKRLKELKEKEDIATEMARKASMPVVIQSVKVNGKPFTAEPIEVDFAKDKSISITGEIESGVKPREVTFSTEKTDFIKGNLSSSQERGDKVITTFSYSLPIGNVAGTSGKVTIGSSAGGSNGYQEILIKVSQASQDAALAGLKKFLDEAGKIQPGPNAAANFEKIRNDMVSYLKTSGLEQGSAEVVRIMNEISTIQSGLSAQSGPIGFPAGQKPPPTTGPMDYYLLNPRLNSFGLNTASGDVVITRGDLKQGAIEITARLSTIDKIEKLLFSEDAGMTWKEINKSQDISYSFMPMPDKLYQPLLKIKTTDMRDAEIRVFPNINGIIYKDINYDQLAAETMKKIAEAYETQNFGLFSQYVSRDYLGNKTFLDEGVRTDFDLFTNIRLTIYINRIDKRGNIFAVDTRWDKTQTPRNTGQEQRTSGNTTFMFVIEEGKMKIQNLRGNLIYATLQPEIAQASGLPQTVVNEIRVANQERNPVQPGAGETEQPGGTSQIINVNNGTVHCLAGPTAKSFAFASGTESDDKNAGDIHFEHGAGNNVFEANGSAKIQKVTGTYTFENLNEAPTIVDEGFVMIQEGDVLLIVTIEGYYCKVKITSITNVVDDYTVQFQYAVQTDGSKNLRTQ